MPRVKRGKAHLKRRKNILAQTKGYKWGRKSKVTLAKTAILKAGRYAYRDRRVRKREMRALWQTQINAAARQNGLSFSRLIDALNKAGIKLDRKILAHLAGRYPQVFSEVVNAAKK
jgi:large subunit ribosomal protein L20